MTEQSVHQWIESEQSGLGEDWEEDSYREGCAYARERAITRLRALDDELLRCKPNGWTVLGFRERTMVTRFGDVVVRRRMYRDTEGRTVFALDEYLGWRPRQLASPSITECVVEMATEMPFRKVSDTVSALTAGELSSRTAHRLLQSVGEEALADERERWDGQFERGEDVSEGTQRMDILYTEADGVWIHLQREDRTHHELKSAIAYRGWWSVGPAGAPRWDDRYELVDKRVYCHASERIPFWEGASLEWDRQYALDGVNLFVVGGDGANWIRRGVDELGGAVFQLDGFHLSRACGRGYGGELGSAIYDAIRSGAQSFARALMSALRPPIRGVPSGTESMWNPTWLLERTGAIE